MPSIYYKRIFIPGYFYHIYNRGANKKRVFKDAQDHKVFVDILKYYLEFPQGKPLSILQTSGQINMPKTPAEQKSSVILIAYCLMPNHYHLLLKQARSPSPENNITNLLRRVTITYAMYAKNKYNRSGTLFEGKFKNILVDHDSQLLQLTKYIHRNPIEIIGSEPLESYPYSSYPSYLKTVDSPKWLEKTQILSHFPEANLALFYKNFVEESPANSGILKKVVLETIKGSEP